MKNRFLAFLGGILAALKGFFTKERVIAFLKEKVIKWAIKRLLGAAAKGGFSGWIVGIVVGELFDNIAEPHIKGLFNNLGYAADKLEGEIKFKELQNARNDHDQDSYDHVTDDIFVD